MITGVKFGPTNESYLVTYDNGLTSSVPLDPDNSDYQAVQIWIGEGNTVQAAYSAAELLEQKREAKIEEVRQEGLGRIQLVLPGITDFETLELIREFWLSIAPASRQATATFQEVIDIYQAGKAGITFLRTATEAEIDAYDASIDPSWPV